MKYGLFLVLLLSTSAFGAPPENSRFLFKNSDKEYFILEPKMAEYEGIKRPIAVTFIRTIYGSYVEDVKTVLVLQGSNCKHSKGTLVRVHPVTGQTVSSIEKWDNKKTDANSMIAKEICSKVKQ